MTDTVLVKMMTQVDRAETRGAFERTRAERRLLALPSGRQEGRGCSYRGSLYELKNDSNPVVFKASELLEVKATCLQPGGKVREQPGSTLWQLCEEIGLEGAMSHYNDMRPGD